MLYISILLGVLVWLAEAIIDYLVFDKGAFFELLIFKVPAHELYIRSVTLGGFVAFGAFASVVIGKQKKLEKTAKKEKKLFLDAIEALTHPFYVVDAKDYTVKLANSAANTSLLAKDKRCHVLMHAEPTPCADKNTCPLESVKQTGKPVKLEHEHFDKNGNSRTFEVHGYPVFDDQGNITDMIEYCLDVTEQKKVQAKIKSLAKFPSENPLPVLRISEKGEVLYANEAAKPFCQKWNCNIGGILESQLEVFKVITDSFKLGQVKNVELAIGDKVFIFAIVPVVGENYVNMYGFDITEPKITEQKLFKAMDMKSHFVSMVSHELRTPLAAIKDGVEIVLDRMLGDINQEQEKFLNIAKSNADRLGRLVDEVLDFQKLGAGKFELDIKENDMNLLAKDVKNMMAKMAEDKSLNFELELDNRLPVVKFDKDKITQVVLNLVNNSIKFTEQGHVKILTSLGDNFIQLSVEDTGPGIKKEDLGKLFAEFEQVPITQEIKTTGTGLGLAICKEIIGMHNGKIWAESIPGKGSVFSFILPIRERRNR